MINPKLKRANILSGGFRGSPPDCGQGEYVLSYVDGRVLERKVWDEVYDLVMKHSRSHDPQRGFVLNQELLKLYPGLRAGFVPRTYYELIFIRLCILEDLKYGKMCTNLWLRTHKTDELKSDRVDCWHECCFDDEGSDEKVKGVAYRMNQVISKLNPPFTIKRLFALVGKEIVFFKNHFEQHQNNFDFIHSHIHSPTTNFATNNTYGGIKCMPLDEDHEDILYKALILECSAQDHVLIFRGSDIKTDNVQVEVKGEMIPRTFSFGTSVFAGCVYDGGATAFYYMRRAPHAYVLKIPFSKMKSSIFFVPQVHTLAQLYGTGEKFHVRTKCWKEFPVEKIRGVNCSENNKLRDHLKSDISKVDFLAEFKAWKEKAIFLK